MKKVTLACILLLSVFIANAHHLVKKCWYNGLYTLTAVDAPVGGTMHIQLINGTGTYNVTINVTSVNQDFSVPQPLRNTPVDVYVTYSDGITNFITTGRNSCSTLALSKVYVNYSSDSEGNTVVYISLDDESDVVSLRIVDRKTRKVYTIIKPSGVKVYTVTLK